MDDILTQRIQISPNERYPCLTIGLAQVFGPARFARWPRRLPSSVRLSERWQVERVHAGLQLNPRRENMSELVTLAESLIPLIRELRHTTENDRRIAEPIVKEIRKSDLCRMLLDTGAPPRYTPEEWLRVLETLAGVEASVSWLVWNNTLPCFWARFLDDAGRARLFGDESVVRGFHTTDRTGRGYARRIPVERPLVARVRLRTCRLSPSHQPGVRRWCAAHARSRSARPSPALRTQGPLRHPRHLACRGLTRLGQS